LKFAIKICYGVYMLFFNKEFRDPIPKAQLGREVEEQDYKLVVPQGRHRLPAGGKKERGRV
jgi:hypothetical protein